PATSTIADAMLADAARRASRVDLDDIVSRDRLRLRGLQAASAAILLLVMMVAARGPARQTVDALALALYPSTVRLDIVPGDARVQAGAPLAIRARLAGTRAAVIPQVRIAEGDRWRTVDMST